MENQKTFIFAGVWTPYRSASTVLSGNDFSIFYVRRSIVTSIHLHFTFFEHLPVHAESRTSSTGKRRESHLFYRYTQRFATFAGTCRGSRHLLVYVEGLQSAYFIFSMRLSFQIFYILLSKSVGYSFGSLLLCSSMTGHFGLCLIPQLYVPIPSQLCWFCH